MALQHLLFNVVISSQFLSQHSLLSGVRYVHRDGLSASIEFQMVSIPVSYDLNSKYYFDSCIFSSSMENELDLLNGKHRKGSGNAFGASRPKNEYRSVRTIAYGLPIVPTSAVLSPFSSWEVFARLCSYRDHYCDGRVPYLRFTAPSTHPRL